MQLKFRLRFRLLVAIQPLALSRVVNVHHPLLIASDGLFEKVFAVAPEQKQIADGDTVNFVVMGQNMWNPCTEFPHFAHCVKVLFDGGMGAAKLLRQFTGGLPRIDFQLVPQFLVIDHRVTSWPRVIFEIRVTSTEYLDQ